MWQGDQLLMTKYIFVFLASIFFLGCSKSAIELREFNRTTWEQDKNGCGGTRKTIIETIVEQKSKLMGAEQKQITNLLGKADKYELYKRNQYFLVYSIDPGSSCADYNKNKTANLTIRFNALGRVNEVVYYP